MTIETRQLQGASLGTLVERLKAEGRHILAPVRQGETVNFAEISSLGEMAQDYITTVQSAKSAVFPKVESLFEVTIERDGVTLQDRDLVAVPQTVLLGGRPCDAASMAALNAIFGWDDLVDTIFAERLKKLVTITMSCTTSDSRCFCTSVNGGPGNTAGSDLLLTPVSAESYLVEVVTGKGAALVAQHADLFQAGGDLAAKEGVLTEVPVAFVLQAILRDLPGSFENGVWLEQSLRCLGCGACAFACPTCACFDIQDVRQGKVAQRQRTWDACGLSVFTLHASGHNPRSTQDSRWRQRVMHKFAYMPERQHVVGCVGCGRCGRACPVDMDLKQHLVHLAEALRK